MPTHKPIGLSAELNCLHKSRIRRISKDGSQRVELLERFALESRMQQEIQNIIELKSVYAFHFLVTLFPTLIFLSFVIRAIANYNQVRLN